MKKAVLAAVAVFAVVTLMAPAAAADDEKPRREKIVYRVHTMPHQADGDSTVKGKITIRVHGNQAMVQVRVFGLAPNLPHAQHIHGVLGADNSCPPPEADENGDGLISVAEGAPFYGGIQVSLTTEGDSSPDSALAVDRFPVADDKGQISYDRTFELSDELLDNLRNLHYVVHGVDVNNNGEYDFDSGVSSINEELPLEATVPGGCGGLEDPNPQPVLRKKVVYRVHTMPHDEGADGGSNVKGKVTVRIKGNEAVVQVRIFGLAPNLPHAQHFHGMIGADNMCPPAEADTNGDGLVDAAEGAPFYEGIALSLTTEGDSSPESALAVDRFPVADDQGRISYERRFFPSEDMLENFSDLHYVVHGIDLNGNGEYDFDAGPSSLTDDLPLEGTIPAGCGSSR